MRVTLESWKEAGEGSGSPEEEQVSSSSSAAGVPAGTLLCYVFLHALGIDNIYFRFKLNYLIQATMVIQFYLSFLQVLQV